MTRLHVQKAKETHIKAVFVLTLACKRFVHSKRVEELLIERNICIKILLMVVGFAKCHLCVEQEGSAHACSCSFPALPQLR